MFRFFFAVIVSLAGVSLQRGPVPPATGLEDASLTRLCREYARGHADAAVEELSRRRPPDYTGTSPVADPPPDQFATGPACAMALFKTEAGMRRGTFGRYARTAPLTPAPPSVGLTGRFEFESLVVYRDIKQLAADALRARHQPILDLIRSWYIVTVSYCLRWKLDCAPVLVASAREDFPDDPEILLLAGSEAEAAGRITEATTLLRRALAADRSLMEARVRLGRIAMQRGQLGQARQELDRALAGATAGQRFPLYFSLVILGQLEDRAGRAVSARARAKQAAIFWPFDDATPPWFTGLRPWDLYRLAQFWQIPDRIAAWRGASATLR